MVFMPGQGLMPTSFKVVSKEWKNCMQILETGDRAGGSG